MALVALDWVSIEHSSELVPFVAEPSIVQYTVVARTKHEASRLAFWQRGSLVLYFPKIQTNMPPRFRSCDLARAEHRNALVLAMLEGPLREGESLEPETSA